MSNLEKIAELTDSLSRVELNLHEEKSILEFILEHTTDGYWDWDIPTGYEYLSPKFKAQLGYAPNEMENTPEAWQTICNTDDVNHAGTKIQAIFAGDKDEFDQILRFSHKDGYLIKILCRGKVVHRDKNGAPVRMIGTHTIIGKEL